MIPPSAHGPDPPSPRGSPDPERESPDLIPELMQAVPADEKILRRVTPIIASWPSVPETGGRT